MLLLALIKTINQLTQVKLSINDGSAIQVTASEGISMFISNETPKQFIQCADDAMYLSKKNGKNQVTIVN